MNASMAHGESSRPSVAIVIVNWNAGVLLRRCLESVAAADWTTVDLAQVVVVDNGSTDGSAEWLSSSAPMPVVVIRNQDNRGFAAACNQGARGIAAGYVLFLNPDTVLEARSIAAAVEWLADPGHSDTGILGIQLVDASGQISRSCAEFPTPAAMLSRALGLDRIWPSVFPDYVMTGWDHRSSRHVDHVIGAFYLMRTPLFEHLAGFDERFFVYLEDLDLSLRAAKAGASAYYLSSSRAFHQGGGASERIQRQRLFYALRSRLQYSRKHYSRAGSAVVSAATLLFEPWVRAAACLLGRSPTSLADTFGAYQLLWRSWWTAR